MTARCTFATARGGGCRSCIRRNEGTPPASFFLIFSVMATHTEPGPADAAAGWTIESAKSLYNVEGWGAGFFDVNAKGHVVVRPDAGHADRELDLYELANDLEEQGVQLPVLLRFSDILRSRLDALSQ